MRRWRLRLEMGPPELLGCTECTHENAGARGPEPPGVGAGRPGRQERFERASVRPNLVSSIPKLIKGNKPPFE